MRVNFMGLGDQSNEPFWRFISCCLSSSPEVLSSDPDLSDLSISLTLNEKSVDLLRAWKMYEEYKPAETTVTQSAERDVPPATASRIGRTQLEELINSVRALQNDVADSVSSLSDDFDNAIDYAASAAADVAADYARERVSEEGHENGPGFCSTRENLWERCDDLVNEIQSMIDEA